MIDLTSWYSPEVNALEQRLQDDVNDFYERRRKKRWHHYAWLKKLGLEETAFIVEYRS